MSIAEHILGLHHIAILAKDREASLRFYTCLGFELYEQHRRPERQDEILMLKKGDVVLELFIAASHPERVTSPEAYGLRHLALAADDVQAVCDGLKRFGYAPEEIRYDTFSGKAMTFVKDPDGLPIELHE